jgi:hypothetical protein
LAPPNRPSNNSVSFSTMEGDGLPSRTRISSSDLSSHRIATLNLYDRTPPPARTNDDPNPRHAQQPATVIDERGDALADHFSAVTELVTVDHKDTSLETGQARPGAPGVGRRASRDGFGSLNGNYVPSGKGSLRKRTGLVHARPLLPVSESKSQEEQLQFNRLRRDTETERPDITPDGGSAGREGRQFAVANVGNNGRIYLR